MPSIKVSFYNEEHRKLLENTPKYEIITKLVEDGFDYSNEDLWTYGLFREQKPIFGFNNFEELKSKLPQRWGYIEDYFDLNSDTIIGKYHGSDNQDKSLTETLGIGAALALISHIHGLTQADWNIIPPYNSQKLKDLDFCIASDGEQIIEVEAKGSYVETDKISTSISNMKGDIESKKQDQRTKANNNNILYGVITSYSSNPEIMAHCRILDPPAVYELDNPRKLKLLSRLSFYLQQLNLLSRANYLIALANRIRDIQVLDNYEALNLQPLINRFGDIFEIPDSYTLSRTLVLNRSGVGEVFPISSDEYYFFGLDLAIIQKIINQSFSDIMDYRCDFPNSFEVTVNAKIKIRDLAEYNININELPQATDRNRVTMNLSGTLFSNSAGIIFGKLYQAEN